MKSVIIWSGKPTPSKTDEFSEKFQRGVVGLGGGGHFQSKNLCCKIWTFKQGYLTMKLIQSNSQFKKIATQLSENEGGGQRPFGTFPKIHPFWMGSASLRKIAIHTFCRTFCVCSSPILLSASFRRFHLITRR